MYIELKFEDDFCISQECSQCGHIVNDTEDDFGADCEKCGAEDTMLNTTSHEDDECESCGKVFDMWADAYRDRFSNNLYCETCADNLDTYFKKHQNYTNIGTFDSLEEIHQIMKGNTDE